jgi:hypothetical protein
MQPNELTRVIGVAIWNLALCFFVPSCLWAASKLPGNWPRAERWHRNLFSLARPPFFLWVWCAFGALIFEALETEQEEQSHARYVEVMNAVRDLDSTLYEDLLQTTGLRDPDEELWRNWDFFGSVFYCFSLCSTIGYGEFNPKTDAGKVATILYAACGIPVFAYLFNSFAQACLRILGGQAVELVDRRVDVVLKTESTSDGKFDIERMRNIVGKANLGVSDTVLEHLFLDVGKDRRHLDHVQFTRLIGLVKDWGRKRIEFRIACTLFVAFFAVIPFYWNMGSYLDGLYFASISYFTVGLGDLIPHTGDTSSWRAAPYMSRWANFNGMPLMLLGVGVSLGIILIKTTAAVAVVNTASYAQRVIKVTGTFSRNGSQKFKRPSGTNGDPKTDAHLTIQLDGEAKKRSDAVVEVVACEPSNIANPAVVEA